MSDNVNHPDHYTRFGAEVIEITEHLNFNRGNAVKYLARAGAKTSDPLQDLLKAEWYVKREISRTQAGAALASLKAPLTEAEVTTLRQQLTIHRIEGGAGRLPVFGGMDVTAPGQEESIDAMNGLVDLVGFAQLRRYQHRCSARRQHGRNVCGDDGWSLRGANGDSYDGHKLSR